ncbi:unnamed protein product [Ilex paraguariensis]|uniref:AT-hook motif nuclear-localized protein n=1 Tax=Ilex paraguariensis TaxID=185542 RepID=A0ABC8RW57_9AQUA
MVCLQRVGEPSSTIPPHGLNLGAPSDVTRGEPVPRKRGRPRKYGHDGIVSLGFVSFFGYTSGQVSASSEVG